MERPELVNPEILNTDQGCQLTSAEVTQPLPGDECQIAGDEHGSTLAADLISDRLGSGEDLDVKFSHMESLRQPGTATIQLPAGSRLAEKRNLTSGYTGGAPTVALRLEFPSARRSTVLHDVSCSLSGRLLVGGHASMEAKRPRPPLRPAGRRQKRPGSEEPGPRGFATKLSASFATARSFRTC